MAGKATRRTLAQADAVTTVSEAMTQHVINEFGCDSNNVTTIINGFDSSVFYPRDRSQMRAKFGIGADKKVVMYVGRLVATKGLRELVDAFARLHAQDDRALLILAGDGVMREELEAKVTAHNLADAVLFLGGIEPAVVAQYLGAADLLTLPSWSEGYPNVLVEAIACGRPVVSTRVGGVSEIVNPGNGRFAPIRDAGGLSDCLREVLEQDWDAEQISAAIQRSWKDVAAETLKLVDQVVRRSGPSSG
jgi:glycosyltransferase involved in cell wall biosynthesis